MCVHLEEKLELMLMIFPRRVTKLEGKKEVKSILSLGF
jgi:hypothetical protein